MKKALDDVKSCVTIIMTIGLVGLLFIPNINPPTEIIALFCTSYGSIMTYFFTKDNKSKEEQEEDYEIYEEGEE